MKKTSIYLEPEIDIALSRLASASGKTKAEVIRASLKRAVSEEPRVRISAIGVGKGPGNVADNVDKQLEESKFGSA